MRCFSNSSFVIPCNVHLSGLPSIPSPHVLVVDSALFVQNNFFCHSLKYSFVREPFESIVNFWQDFGAITSSKRYFPIVIFCLRVSLMTTLVLGTGVVISPPKFSFFFLSVKWTSFNGSWTIQHSPHFFLRNSFITMFPTFVFANAPNFLDLWNNDKKIILLTT